MRTVGGVIDANQAAIVQMWMEGSREALFAEGLTQLQLKNMMPEYLSLLGRGRPGDSAGLSGAQQALIERHLSNRLRQGAVLNEILTEFAVLGRCVSRFLGSEDGADRPSVADIGRLFAELSLTCAAVTRIFSEHLLEDEQTEKRYSRLLRDIGGQSIERGHAMSLKRQVKEALALIAQAMGAQTAALLLHDAKTDRLIMSASRGVADEELEAYVRELEISAEESAQPPVSEALGRGGIQSVLSARLVPCHLLRGVLHVGFREERTFTANEVRRLHSLGDVLAVHLDNVHLNASLNERSEQIAAECDLRERFVSILMHDLMGPLAAARAGARKLLEDSIDGTQASATTIARSLARMEHMVHGLLDAHRIRAGTSAADGDRELRPRRACARHRRRAPRGVRRPLHRARRCARARDVEPRSAAARDLEPGRQWREAWSQGRAGRHLGEARGRRGRAHRPQPGPGHPERGPGGALQTVLAPEIGRGPPAWMGARAHARVGLRGLPRGPRERREPRGSGHDLQARDPDGRSALRRSAVR
jgi:hypothetical protein